MKLKEPREPLKWPKLLPFANPVPWKDFLSDDSGQDMIEYVLVAAFLALVSITALSQLGTKLSTAYTNLSTSLTSNT